jgi:hypothetical protein
MTIQDKSRSVLGLLKELECARQEHDLAEALNKRAEELREVQEPFVAAAASLQALREHGIVSESRLPDSSKAVDKLASMRLQLSTEPRDVTKGQAFNSLRRSVEKLASDYGELVAEAWNEHVKEVAPPVEKALLDQYRDSPQHEGAVTEIEDIVRELKPFIKKPPPNADTLQLIEQKWEQLRSRLSTLPISDDSEVQAFLNAAISGDGAALDLLTASVRRWLDENNMLTDFCIRRSK